MIRAWCLQLGLGLGLGPGSGIISAFFEVTKTFVLCGVLILYFGACYVRVILLPVCSHAIHLFHDI